MKAPRCHWIVAACLALMPVLRAGAQLSDSSPFAPTGTAGVAGAQAENEPLELRGIMAAPDGLRVCIYDAARKTSKWVRLNETADGTRFVVKSADPDLETASVQSDGRVMTLALRKAKVESSGPATGYQAGVSYLGPVALNPTPADDQRRLQAVQAEVRRRRLAREAADRLEDQRNGRSQGASSQ
jgi:hypothetical protein